jgi:hypothetical protein
MSNPQTINIQIETRDRLFRAFHVREARFLQPEELPQIPLQLASSGRLMTSGDIILMEYTQKDDADGTHIFEGDICQVDLQYDFGNLKAVGVMQWFPNYGVHSLNIYQPKVQFQEEMKMVANPRVLGDVYTTPNLLANDPYEQTT